jgi:ATP-dependent Lhr-like helicase
MKWMRCRSDDGFILRFPDADRPPDPHEVILEPAEVGRLVLDEVGSSAVFSGRFREAAGRALLLPRRRPGKRTPLWLQRRRSTSLLEAARRYPAFPIILEAYREVLQEHFDVPALESILTTGGGSRWRPTRTAAPSHPRSPSTSASFMYDTPLPWPNVAMALTIDRGFQSARRRHHDFDWSWRRRGRTAPAPPPA